MNTCKIGFHKWVYTYEGNKRRCETCQKKQDMDGDGKWADTVTVKPPADAGKYCACPNDYTISLKSMSCPRCGLPRRPRQSM